MLKAKAKVPCWVPLATVFAFGLYGYLIILCGAKALTCAP